MHRVQRGMPAGRWRDWRQAGTGCNEAACGADGRSGWRNRAFRRPGYSAGPRWWGLIHLRRERHSRCLIAGHKTTPAGMLRKAAGFGRAMSRTARRTVTAFGGGAIRERTAVDFVPFMEGAVANADGCWRCPPVRKNRPATAVAPGEGGRACLRTQPTSGGRFRRGGFEGVAKAARDAVGRWPGLRDRARRPTSGGCGWRAGRHGCLVRRRRGSRGRPRWHRAPSCGPPSRLRRPGVRLRWRAIPKHPWHGPLPAWAWRWTRRDWVAMRRSWPGAAELADLDAGRAAGFRGLGRGWQRRAWLAEAAHHRLDRNRLPGGGVNVRGGLHGWR